MTNTRDSHSAMGRIEVITSVERRRRWPRAEKERLVAAMMEPEASVAEIARKAGVDPSLLYRWRQQLAAANDIPSFVPVMVTPPPDARPNCRLRRLRLSSGRMSA